MESTARVDIMDFPEKVPGIPTMVNFIENSRLPLIEDYDHYAAIWLDQITEAISGCSLDLEAMAVDYIFSRSYNIKKTGMIDVVMPESYYSTFQKITFEESDVTIFYEQRVTTSLKKNIALYNVGIFNIQAGIEALSTDLLTLMNKGTRAEDSICFLRYLQSKGINVIWNSSGCDEEPIITKQLIKSCRQWRNGGSDHNPQLKNSCEGGRYFPLDTRQNRKKKFLDFQFIPLATADPEILLLFEDSHPNQKELSYEYF